MVATNKTQHSPAPKKKSQSRCSEGGSVHDSSSSPSRGTDVRQKRDCQAMGYIFVASPVKKPEFKTEVRNPIVEERTPRCYEAEAGRAGLWLESTPPPDNLRLAPKPPGRIQSPKAPLQSLPPPEPTPTPTASQESSPTAKVPPSLSTTDRRSKLSRIDLSKIFSNDSAWETLSQNEQDAVLRNLPVDIYSDYVNRNCTHDGDCDCKSKETIPPPHGQASRDSRMRENIYTMLLKNKTEFRTDMRLWQEDLAAGRLDPKWQAKAAEAMEERARGEFDTWKMKEFESFWGQKMSFTPPRATNARTGRTAKTAKRRKLSE